jgi:hypothetical protein
MSCYRFGGREDKIVTYGPEDGNDEAKIQP